jgi:hypothetical protein
MRSALWVLALDGFVIGCFWLIARACKEREDWIFWTGLAVFELIPCTMIVIVVSMFR